MMGVLLMDMVQPRGIRLGRGNVQIFGGRCQVGSVTWAIQSQYAVEGRYLQTETSLMINILTQVVN